MSVQTSVRNTLSWETVSRVDGHVCVCVWVCVFVCVCEQGRQPKEISAWKYRRKPKVFFLLPLLKVLHDAPTGITV